MLLRTTNSLLELVTSLVFAGSGENAETQTVLCLEIRDSDWKLSAVVLLLSYLQGNCSAIISPDSNEFLVFLANSMTVLEATTSRDCQFVHPVAAGVSD